MQKLAEISNVQIFVTDFCTSYKKSQKKLLIFEKFPQEFSWIPTADYLPGTYLPHASTVVRICRFFQRKWTALNLIMQMTLVLLQKLSKPPKLSHDKGHHMWFEITLSLGIWAVYIAKRQNGSCILLFFCVFENVKSNQIFEGLY